MSYLEKRDQKRWSELNSIGLFDSGVGGLSVLRALSQIDPDRSKRFVYLGDTARCPYGNRSQNEIATFVTEIVFWLATQKVEAVVMACNTSAAMARDVATSVTPLPVYDLIGSTAQYVADCKMQRIGVLATAGTVRSKAFSHAIARLNSAAEVVEVACPELVPIVEGGTADHPETIDVLNKLCRPLLDAKVESVILGCTHFPFLEKQLQQVADGRFSLIDPAVLLAEALTNPPASTGSHAAINPFHGEVLQERASRTKEERRILDVLTSVLSGPASESKFASAEIFTTGSPQQFEETARRALGYAVGTVGSISVEELQIALPAVSSEELVNTQASAVPVV